MTAASKPTYDDALRELTGRTKGRLISINTSFGGVPKMPVAVANVALFGLYGDAQNDRRWHGGPERAVSIYSLEIIRALQAEGHPIDVGTTGENLTVSGLDWSLVLPGCQIKVGAHVRLEIASFTKPCKTIRESFIGSHFVRISQKVNPGWSRVYARVLAEGEIRTGDAVEVSLTPG